MWFPLLLWLSLCGLCSLTHPRTVIEQVVYINLDEREDRDAYMRAHVLPLFPGIPTVRVSALRGNESDKCIPQKASPARCRGLVGILKTNLGILSSVREPTLILEDDVRVESWEKLERAVASVPADWDIIRFDCIDTPPASFPQPDALGVFRTMHVSPPSPTSWFCGGAFAMLVRPASVSPLRELWGSLVPYDDLDCRLTTPRVKSYCVNQGVVRHLKMGTNIPKLVPRVLPGDTALKALIFANTTGRDGIQTRQVWKPTTPTHPERTP